MSSAGDNQADDGLDARSQVARGEQQFKKLKRPLHAAKRSNTPARLRGMHRRRKRRIDW